MLTDIRNEKALVRELRARAAGCDRFQGYYFGKPAFPEDIRGDRMDYGNWSAEREGKQSVA